MPLGLFRLRNISVANGVAVLMAGSMFGWFFLSALYLQLVLGYSPLEVGFAYLPSTLIMGAGSIALSDRLVMRFGVKPPIVFGLSCFAVGLLLFARTPADGNFLVDVLPGMIVMGIGGGITFNPLLLAAMGDVAPSESGLASGIVNTAFMMGGALGLAVLVSVSDSRSDSLRDAGDSVAEALTGGYHAGFIVAAVFAAAGSRSPLPASGHAAGSGAAGRGGGGAGEGRSGARLTRPTRRSRTSPISSSLTFNGGHESVAACWRTDRLAKESPMMRVRLPLALVLWAHGCFRRRGPRQASERSDLHRDLHDGRRRDHLRRRRDRRGRP